MLVDKCFFFIPALRDQIIGPTLGDACINYSWSSTTPYFKFTQALSKINYLLYAFYFLAPLCQSMPNIVISMRKGKQKQGVFFITRPFPFLKTIHSIFYLEVKGK